MSNFETIRLTAKDSVAKIMLNRADKHNAINALMIRELRQAADQVANDNSVRVVVLTAAGKSFCAGGDLNWMKQQASKDRAGKISESSELARMLRDLDELPKPLIACVQGPAYGGGIGMICVCDIAVASAAAKFALTETRLGLIPATIGPYVIRRLGEANARQVFMNSKVFDAEAALKLGLVSTLAQHDELDEVVQSEVDAFLNCAPGAVADAKSLCLELSRNQSINQLDYTANKLADRWETLEARQGIDAFFNREKPPWTK